ncbi:MAG: DUF1800 domain-containing protein [Candidatus Eremiobacteraeota bacterium]|nr:DUF1800 domain-containing protein [Candidatus Eremiobacteraeota bacterium]
MTSSATNRPAGQLDISTALSPYSGPWNTRLAAHLLRRAGFGGSPDDVRRLAGMNVHDAVESFIHFPPTAGSPAPAGIFDPYAQGILPLQRGGRGMGMQMDDTARRDKLKDIRRQSRQSIIALQKWWIDRMVTTPAPLQEKMTFFFHGHFTTAAIQKGVWPSYVYNQNQLFRDHALGNLRDLTLAVSKDPGMLLYLDNARSAAAHPNENYARELMELFTLGHGNYTEQDIRESARAFTGWSVNPRDGQFLEVARMHDNGTKQFMGRRGNFSGEDIVNIIFQQPASAKFFASELLSFFVYNDPEPQLVDAVAGLLKQHDYNLAPVMSRLLMSNVFFSDRAYRALVKSPVEFVVGSYKVFGLKETDRSAQQALMQMGQILFYPPNVAGWPGGTNWLTSQMMIARENFATGLVNSQMMAQSSWLTAVPMDATKATHQLVTYILSDDASPAAETRVKNYLNGSNTSALGMFSMENYDERVRGAAYLTMAMPAFQLN